MLRQRRRSPGPGAALQGRSHRARTGTDVASGAGGLALQRTCRVARVRFESDTPRRAKGQARGPGQASPAPSRRLRRPEFDDGCPRLPQAAPTYPTSRRVAFLAPRDLYVEAPRLGRGGPTPTTRCYQSTKLKTTGRRGTCDLPEPPARPRSLFKLELARRRGRAVRRPPL